MGHLGAQEVFVLPAHFDVVIVGGGLCGGSLALALSALPVQGTRLRVCVIDRKELRTSTRVLEGQTPRSSHHAGMVPESRDDEDDDIHKVGGRAFAIAAASWDLLEQLGIADYLTEQSQPIREIRVLEQGGKAGEFVHFSADSDQNHDEKTAQCFGRMVESHRLRAAQLALLEEAVAKEKITYFGGYDIEGVEEQFGAVAITAKPRLGLNESTLSVEEHEEKTTSPERIEIKASLFVACDGGGSTFAQQWGIPTINYDYQQHAVVCTVAHRNDHGATAVEGFFASSSLDLGKKTLDTGRKFGGAIATLPLLGRRSNIVLTVSHAQKELLLALSPQEYLAFLKSLLDDWLDIAETTPPLAYPLRLKYAKKAGIGRRIVLGDAAHLIHPIAGQGLNVGLRDVIALSRLVMEAQQAGIDLGSNWLVRRYESQRAFDSATTAIATHSILRVFGNEATHAKQVRGWGMRTVNHIGRIKALMVNRATGAAALQND